MLQLFSILLVFLSLSLLLTQLEASPKGAPNPLFKSAHEAVIEKKCLGEYVGEVSMTHKIVSSCFAGGFVQEVHVHPCVEGKCENVNAAAKVVYRCDVTKPHVKCL